MMSTWANIKEARKLLWESTRLRQRAMKILGQINHERYRQNKEAQASAPCVCGHRRKDHSDSYSVNYTGGCCSRCEYMHFMTR